jgi:hypothetical protein
MNDNLNPKAVSFNHFAPATGPIAAIYGSVLRDKICLNQFHTPFWAARVASGELLLINSILIPTP